MNQQNKNNKELFRLPFVRFAPFMAAGMILAYFCSGGVCAVFIVFAAAFAVYLFIKRSAWALCAVGAAVGLLIVSLYMQLYFIPISEYSGKSVQGEFVVTEIRRVSGDHQEITAKMTLDGRTAKVALNCETRLTEGQTARAKITFGEFDEEYKLYAMANGILLSGSAKELEIVSGEVAEEGLLRIIRAEFIGAVEETLFGEERALAKAMLFGDDGELSQSARERLRICGAAHFTAVSGAHFAVFGAVILGMIPPKKRRTRAVFSLMFAPLAIVFFGSSVSVLRAAVMFVINGAAMLFRRSSEPLNTLCAAFVIIALFSPGIILDIGFAMSVFGVFGVAVVGARLSEKLCGLLPKKAKALSPVITALTVSASAVICTAPLSTAFFRGVSLTGTFTSILLTPLMAVGAVSAALTAATGAGFFALPLAAAMKLANIIITLVGNIRYAWLPLNFKGAWVLAALFAVILAIGTFHSMRLLRASAICMAMITVFCFAVSAYISKTRNTTVLIGNSRGSAKIVISDCEADVVIDGSGGGLAEKISRCLRENGAQRINILTAHDADFTGALAVKELSELVEIGYVDSNEIVTAVLNSVG